MSKMSITLSPTLFLSGASEVGMTPSNVIQYEVRGLPPSLTAIIRRKNERWQILRVNDNVPGAWSGNYKTPEDALAAIRSEAIA